MHRWGGKMKVTRGETQWTNNRNLESEDMWSSGHLRVRGATKKKNATKLCVRIVHLAYADVC
jgi:hypothetical protein